MAYEFKKLSDVATVETPADTANVLIEEDGVIKKAPKENIIPSDVALKTDIPDAAVSAVVAVDTAEEPSETANVLVEDGGTLKRVPVGSVGGFKTAIIKDSNYDIVLGGGTADTENVTFSCVNMTYEEARAVVDSGDVLNAIIMFIGDGCMIVPAWAVAFAPEADYITLIIAMGSDTMPFYWTVDGISTTEPTTTTSEETTTTE